MKHLLNDLSEEEKNRIREQHTGGKKVVIENFKKLVNTKLGDAKPYLNEEEEMKGAPQKITSNEGYNYTYDIAPISLTKEDVEKRKGLKFDELKFLVKTFPNENIVVNIKGETRGWTASLVGKDELVLNMITD
jgi:hypothetical protein